MVPDSSRRVRQYTAIVAAVAGVDLLSKQLASLLLADGGIALAGPLHLVLTSNTGSVFGISLGPYTWHWNTLATFAALLLTAAILRPLCAVDRRAPIGLGLIGGAALGNLASLLVPPAGVTDFLMLRLDAAGGIIMNLADVAAFAGVAMIARSALLLRVAIAAERAGTVRPSRVDDREIPIPVLAEGPRPVARAAHDGGRDRPMRAVAPYGEAREAPRRDA